MRCEWQLATLHSREVVFTTSQNEIAFIIEIKIDCVKS